MSAFLHPTPEVRLNLDSRLQQTISFELFDDVSGWQWDVYKTSA